MASARLPDFLFTKCTKEDILPAVLQYPTHLNVVMMIMARIVGGGIFVPILGTKKALVLFSVKHIALNILPYVFE